MTKISIPQSEEKNIDVQPVQLNLSEEKIPSKDTVENIELDEGMDVVLEKWTFRKILRGIKNGKIIVDHDFQRDEIYRTLQKSGIINSALSGKCIPPLYAFEERTVDGKIRLSILDGQQRLSAIRDFMSGQLELQIPFGKYSILNGYTYIHIEKINKNLADQIGDLTIDINVIRNINKEQAQEYFGLINTTSMPLSPGEKLWSIHDPVKTILREIVENKYFKITNLRKTRKREYVIATKLLWNQMFNDPLKHEYVGDRIQEFMNYFNSTSDLARLQSAQRKVLNLLKIYSEIVDECQFSPRTQGDLYCVLNFISLMRAKDEFNKEDSIKFFDWIFRGINKKVYPYRVRDQFEYLLNNRVSGTRHISPKEFVITLEYLYKEEMELWCK